MSAHGLWLAPCLSQVAAAQEDIERLAAARSAAAAEAEEAEAAAQQALEAGHAEVMKLRRRWDELSAQVAGLGQERDALLEQIAEDKVEWARLQQVNGPMEARVVVHGAARTLSTSVMHCLRVMMNQDEAASDQRSTLDAHCLPPQLESDALAAREAKLGEDRARLQAELDQLLGRQEERLRMWEARCAEQEAALEEGRAELEGDKQR
jgi:septal ring factor EnvC (AmiA/AmiB activator)